MIEMCWLFVDVAICDVRDHIIHLFIYGTLVVLASILPKKSWKEKVIVH